ncbi:hypothetical protein, partial [Acinetobacter baumannii]|uniref:hypothetical protein n=1 Tax=Acinetobacter baumannii TaxID=470 RepID=UPI001BB46B49
PSHATLSCFKYTDIQLSSHRNIYFLVVKSVSRFEEPPVSERLQLHASSARFPQAHAEEGSLFSTAALSQVHCSAGCFPQEQVASWAHTQVPLLRPQQTIFECLVDEVGSG